MNKDFMKCMRANYSHVSRQQFNRTVAERERARERDPVTGDVASGGSRGKRWSLGVRRLCKSMCEDAIEEREERSESSVRKPTDEWCDG